MSWNDEIDRAWNWEKLKENTQGLNGVFNMLHDLNKHYSKNIIDDFTLEKDPNDNATLNVKIRFYEKEDDKNKEDTMNAEFKELRNLIKEDREITDITERHNLLIDKWVECSEKKDIIGTEYDNKKFEFINVDLTKIEKELTLQNDLKIQELKMYADELLFDNKLTNREYRAYIKTLNGFRK